MCEGDECVQCVGRVYVCERVCVVCAWCLCGVCGVCTCVYVCVGCECVMFASPPKSSGANGVCACVCARVCVVCVCACVFMLVC